MAIDVSSEPVFLSKKRRISMDVSSGLMFLTKKKKQSPKVGFIIPMKWLKNLEFKKIK